MSNSLEHHYQHACEFTIAIKLNVPIFLEPHVLVKSVPHTTQKVPVHLEPEIYLKPEVSAKPALCLPQHGNGHKREEVVAKEVN
ncbi:MAG: hypothetical protein HC769_19350 [Cyanobacteria bacterium CRU_2_1]|nr:hypothetical protein [Cyanobacteria bacterium RU_5_0]NJR60784.1 hypothetical protein [Cyanobacteria bacterium CRU_2_1]